MIPDSPKLTSFDESGVGDPHRGEVSWGDAERAERGRQALRPNADTVDFCQNASVGVMDQTAGLVHERSADYASRDPLTEAVLCCAFRVHTALGPGLLESTYEACLCHELAKAGIQFERQRPVQVRYDGLVMEIGYRIDVMVESDLVLELKSVDSIEQIHKAQLITYLRLSGATRGLLLNFNSIRLKDGGIWRATNNYRLGSGQ